MASADDGKGLFKLRQEVAGHCKDVRCVANVPSMGNRAAGIVTGSRDNSVRIWREISPDGQLEEKRQLSDSKSAVSAVCVLLPSSQWANGAILAGGVDSFIRCYDALTYDLLKVFEGHAGVVCCFAAHPCADKFASGSWDCTARVWSTTDEQCQIFGHSASVWAVCFINPSGQPDAYQLLSGSADKSITLWTADSVKQVVYKGHTDCVRSLYPLSNDHFLSSSNDSTIRMWHAPSGRCERTYTGHSHYVYSISSAPSQSWFVSSSEDHTVRVWDTHKGDCLQVLQLPCQTVWMVCVLQNGDIACACSDGMLRLYTRDWAGGRSASNAEMEVYEQKLVAFINEQRKESVIGDVRVNDLPSAEALKRPGKKDGQNLMVRNDRNGIDLYSWSASEQKWNHVGAVVGSAGDEKAKPTYMGNEYDYVFDVDIADDQPVLKLPYNVKDDPWTVAQNFITDNQLPPVYLSQVVDFILKNSSDSSTTLTPSNVDPFTGGSSYSSSSLANGTVRTDSVDPYTDAGRYVPSEKSEKMAVVHPLKPRGDDIPLDRYCLFTNVNRDGLLSKLKEFNSSMTDGEKMSADNLAEVEQYLSNLSGQPSVALIKAICKGLEWRPIDCLLPILDCLRLTVLDERGNNFFFQDFPGDEFSSLLCDLLSKMPTASSSTPLQTVLCRTFANCFAHQWGRDVLITCPSNLVVDICSLVASAKDTVQTAAAAVVANFTYAYHTQRTNASRMLENKRILLDALVKGVKHAHDLGVPLHRTTVQCVLQSIVTLLWDNEEIVLYAKVLDTAPLIHWLKDVIKEEKLKHMARSIEAMINCVASSGG